MAIIIAGSIRVPRDKRDYLLTEGHRYSIASRAEPGCVHYNWSADPADPELIHVFEQWTDEISLRNHFTGDAYLSTLKFFADTCQVDADVSKYRVDLIEPVYDREGKPRADFFSA